MELYKKPAIYSSYLGEGIIPLGLAGGLSAVTGISMTKVLVAGLAAAAATAASSRGTNAINSNYLGTLTARKKFSLE